MGNSLNNDNDLKNVHNIENFDSNGNLENKHDIKTEAKDDQAIGMTVIIIFGFISILIILVGETLASEESSEALEGYITCFFLVAVLVFPAILISLQIPNAVKSLKSFSKKTKSKIGKGISSGVEMGANLADKATQRVANKVVQVINEAKQNASEQDEKKELENKVKDLEIELLKKKVKELEDKLK